MPTRKYHSKWECPQCGHIYMSPITGTRALSHPHSKRESVKMVRVWQSSYDKMAK